MNNKNRCTDCGRMIGTPIHSCPTFEELSLFQKGKPPWNKGVIWKRKNHDCLDCKKNLGLSYSTRCRTCSNKFRQGPLASNWRGGITPIIKRERARFREEIKRLVFERDNYTCQMCNARNGLGKDVYLQVDHIQKWSEYVELRFSLDNCRTLCMNCHYFVTFGKTMPNNIKTFGYNYKTRRKV